MGGLRKYMKITWLTSLIGSLALIGTPFLSGFYSKDSIIEAAKISHIPGSGFAYFAVLVGVFVTAFYSFRMYFLVFHGKERWMEAKHEESHHEEDAHSDDHHHGLGPNDVPHEQSWVVTLPLVLLAIPSLAIGYFAIEPMLYGNFFEGVIYVNGHLHPVMHELKEEFHGAFAMAVHSLTTLPFILALLGVILSWVFYIWLPVIPAWIKARLSWVNYVLENKYGFDRFNEIVFAAGSRFVGSKLWKIGDVQIIDGALVNGTANLIVRFSKRIRRIQSGLIYHYAFAMIIGVFLLLSLFMKV
jgi:NADH-quinone oxidoreductase subunit L